ncbi:MAG: hypothetical protein OXQ32_07205 [bacterium]|nr:hypothetical protein [bacterium]
MSVGTLIAEEDWAGRPATKGDLMLVQTHLEGKIKDVEGKIKDVRVEVAHLRVSMAWMSVAVATGLGGLIAVFEFLL